MLIHVAPLTECYLILTWYSAVQVKLSLRTPWMHGGNRLLAPFILNLSTWRKKSVSFARRPLCHRGKSPQNPWNTHWVSPPDGLVGVAGKMTLLYLRKIEPRLLSHLACTLTTTKTDLSCDKWQKIRQYNRLSQYCRLSVENRVVIRLTINSQFCNTKLHHDNCTISLPTTPLPAHLEF